MGRSKKPARDESEERAQNEEMPNNTVERMMKCVEEMVRMMRETMERQLEMLQREIFDLKTAVETEVDKRRRVLQENESLREEVEELKNNTRSLRDRIDEMEQDQLSFDVVLSNIPIINNTEVSNPSDAFKGIVNNTLGDIIQDSDISRINVVRSKDSQSVSLIATLIDMSKKNAIMKDRKKFLNKKIYAKDNLTPARYKLLKVTKEIAKQNNYKFTWVKHGDIYIRKHEGSRVFRVKSIEHLHELLLLNLTSK